MTTALPWQPEELAGWDMPELIPSAAWVERHVRIASGDAAIPGPVDLNITPYLPGMFDALDDPRIEIITLVCATQVGKTTFLHGALMALTAQQPGPVLYVSPTEPDARDEAGGRLKNMVLECEPLMRLATGHKGGLAKDGYTFATCRWSFGWSGSSASMARRACRYVVYDEVAKFPPFVGRESNPLVLGDARLRTWTNTAGSKSIRVSSPTTEDDLIGKSWFASDQRRFWVCCPECGKWQVLAWSQVHWPKTEAGHSLPADTIREDNLAWYECIGCESHWTDTMRYTACRSGIWARKGESVEAGKIVGTAHKPRSNHAGFHVSALYSRFVTVSQLAAGWLDSQHDLSSLMGFVNQELGEFWMEVEAEVKEEPLRAHAGTYLTGTAPARVQIITAFVDVQHGYFVVETRGWGYGLETWILDARNIETEEQLHDYLRDKRFPRVDVNGDPMDEEKFLPLPIRLAGIDSGDQTAYIYELVQNWRDIDLRPTKGADLVGAMKVRGSPIKKNPRTKRAFRHSIMLYAFDVTFWKDFQARMAANEEPGPGYLHLPADIGDDWFRQFASEHKIIDRKSGKRGRSGRPRRVWDKKTSHRANHFWDCAVGNCVLTDEQLLGIRNLPNPDIPQPPPRRRRVGRMKMR